MPSQKNDSIFEDRRVNLVVPAVENLKEPAEYFFDFGGAAVNSSVHDEDGIAIVVGNNSFKIPALPGFDMMSPDFLSGLCSRGKRHDWSGEERQGNGQ